MSYKFIVLHKALLETKEAYLWYENKTNGLGDKFLNEIKKHKSIIASNPEIFKKTYKDFREVPLKMFPFVLLYALEKSKKEIIILSLFHTSRNPKKKYKV